VKRPAVNRPDSLASRFRRRRFAMILELIRPMLEGKDRLRILDIGGRRDYWELLPPEIAPRLEILILNNEDVELETGARPDDGLDVTYVLGDACAMPQYGDASFDLAHSNSVIEHVGTLQNMARMADETRRVARAYYVQTPYLWFPMEPHYGVPFFHWLPAPTRARLGWKRKIGWRAQMPTYRDSLALADHTSLVDRTLMRELFPDAEHHRERFALMTKSLIALRRAA
jgi:hypothetical protein